QQARFQQPGLENWLRQRIKANIGYDRMVREILTAPVNGQPQFPQQGGDGSAAIFFQANGNMPENVAGAVSRLFLGVKLECAQCHNHPFAEWKKTQFWEFAAFFGDLPRVGPQGRPVPQSARGEIKIPGTETVAKARFLD